MKIADLIEQYGIWVALGYLMITDLFPKIIEAWKWVVEKLAPERLAKIKAEADDQKRNDELEQERIAFDKDLRERDIIAKEQTAKALLLIDAHMQASEKGVQDQLTLIMTGLVTANQSLAILMDRSTRIRVTDTAKPS